jgi:hypothetical protein
VNACSKRGHGIREQRDGRRQSGFAHQVCVHEAEHQIRANRENRFKQHDVEHRFQARSARDHQRILSVRLACSLLELMRIVEIGAGRRAAEARAAAFVDALPRGYSTLALTVSEHADTMYFVRFIQPSYGTR